jgi:phospholipase A1
MPWGAQAAEPARAQAAAAATATVTPLLLSILNAPGDQGLQNPAPAAPDEPADSASAAAPTNSQRVQVLPGTTPDAPPELLSPRRVQPGCSLRDYGAPVDRGQLAAAIFNTCSGFSLHKPIFLTVSYSPRYESEQTEVVFQFSGKAQVWDFGPSKLYFAYTQRSFFQMFNEKRSKAFRESNYNPELFLRVPKPLKALPNWSIDVGLEHESNGADLPQSRSYNRIYVAPDWIFGQQAVRLKAWWRIPEDKSRASDDPKRDDNPDLGTYYGYSEISYRRDFDRNNTLLDVTLRGNPNTGRGAVQVDVSTEVGRLGAVFIRAFNGYGDSLIDYNRSVTRLSVGLAIQR